MKFLAWLFLAWLLVAVGAALPGCTEPDATPGDTPKAPHGPQAPLPAPKAVDAPSPAADTPLDLPGIHNLVAFAEGVYSGAVPEGDEGFESLAALGVRTVISVDGAQPDVEAARKHGLRYVHLPIGYDGVSQTRTLELARALRDLPGPHYIHCHHGKHRSAAAAGAAVVTLGKTDARTATERMKISGTSPHYDGLYACVADATPVAPSIIDSASHEFPERAATPGIVQAMVEIDEITEHLKATEKAGWQPPADHPDLVPLKEAARLVDLFRHSAGDPTLEAETQELRDWLARAAEEAKSLEDGLEAPIAASDLSARFKIILSTCKSCHADYRD